VVLKVSSTLKRRAKGSEKEDLMAMGASIEEFAFHLLDPLKRNEEMRDKFTGQDFNDFDRVIDKAVACDQKKV
jgi:hypothetical protein